MTRRLLAALLVTLSLAAGLVVGTAATGAVPPARAAGGDEQAFSDIAGCISGADDVLVSVVVDESLSLRETDPGDLRVRGITTAVDSLEQLAASLPRDTRVHVSLSTFARSFDTLVAWQRLGPGTAQRLRAVAQEELPDRDTGDATDYRQALEGGRRLLDQRARSLGAPEACKVLLWFTDGALDVDAETATAATELCQAGGIVDAIRRDGVAVVALALFTPGAGVTTAQRDQLRAVAEGRGSDTTCGTVPIAAQDTAGIYLPASDPAALAALFGTAGALVGGGTQVGEVTCPGPECPGGRYPLTVDPGVAGARVLVAGGSGVRVTSPSGQALDLSGGGVEADGATVSLVERDGLATLDVSYPRYADQQQVWQVRVRPTRSGPSRLTVFWFWGARLEAQTTTVSAGERDELRLRLLDRTGEPLDLGLYDDVRVTARLGERDLAARIGADGTVNAATDLGVRRLPPTLPLQVSVSARSRPSGTPLGPLSSTTLTTVELPPVYPSLRQEQLDFGTLEGEGTATAELTATGSPRGPTRVCVTGSRVTVPGRAPADLVDSPRRCIDLETSGRARLRLDLTPRAGVDGVATGEVTLTLEPADGSAPLEVDVPLELEMQRVVDESTRWLLVALLVGAALLLPLLVLLLANWLTATFTMTSLTQVAATPVRVSPRGLSPRDADELVGPDDLTAPGFSGRRTERRMALGHTGVTAEVRGAVGLRDARGVAVGPERHVLVSSTPPYRGEGPAEAPLTLGDVDTVLVVLERTGTPGEAEGTLVVVVPGEVDLEGIRERVARLSDRVDWEDVLAEAAQSRDESAPVTAAAPTGASSASAPAGSVGAEAQHPAAPTAAPGREPFPWEDPASWSASPTAPGSGKSGSRGKRRRGTQDSPQRHTERHTQRHTERHAERHTQAHAQKDARTDRTDGRDGGGLPEDDDGLPPLPDFLKED